MNSQNDDIIYLTVNDLYNINEEVTGGLPYVRDRHLLRSAAHRPRMMLFGEPQFPTLHDKAAATLHSLAYHHLFADGNKRTAARATVMFLEANRCHLQVSDDQLYDFVLSVARGNQSVEEIADWLHEHVVCENP